MLWNFNQTPSKSNRYEYSDHQACQPVQAATWHALVPFTAHHARHETEEFTEVTNERSSNTEAISNVQKCFFLF